MARVLHASPAPNQRKIHYSSSPARRPQQVRTPSPNPHQSMDRIVPINHPTYSTPVLSGSSFPSRTSIRSSPTRRTPRTSTNTLPPAALQPCSLFPPCPSGFSTPASQRLQSSFKNPIMASSTLSINTCPILAPIPRPPSRSERLLRSTLDRDTRHCSQPQQPAVRATSPLGFATSLTRVFYSTGSQDNDEFAVDSECESEDESWMYRVRSPQRRTSRATNSPTPLAPRFARSQTTSAILSTSLPRFHSRTHSTEADALTMSRSRTPPRRYSHFATSSPSMSLRPGTTESVARACLTQTLSKDLMKVTPPIGRSRSSQNGGGTSDNSGRSAEHVVSRELSSTESSPRSDLLTPPPSPSFNAQMASRQCKSIDGLIHFSDIEGLGAPPDLTNEEMGKTASGNASRDKLNLLLPTWLNWTTKKDSISTGA